MPAVRTFLGEHGAETVFRTDGDVRLLADRRDEALFSIGDTSDDFPTLTFGLEQERWVWLQSSAGCNLQGWARGRPASPWSIDGDLDRGSARLDVLVTEMECASGTTAEGRIDEPYIEWSDPTAIVTITVRQKDSFVAQTCQSNPPTPFSFRLPAPLGDRELLDGFHVPPAAPGTPMR